MPVTDDSPSATGRSLVPVAQHGTADAVPGAHHARPSSTFLAHLIAAAQGAPQTRARRRTSAGQASALYAASATIARSGAIRVSM
jgi:hypothetical protein